MCLCNVWQHVRAIKRDLESIRRWKAAAERNVEKWSEISLLIFMNLHWKLQRTHTHTPPLQGVSLSQWKTWASGLLRHHWGPTWVLGEQQPRGVGWGSGSTEPPSSRRGLDGHMWVFTDSALCRNKAPPVVTRVNRRHRPVSSCLFLPATPPLSVSYYLFLVSPSTYFVIFSPHARWCFISSKYLVTAHRLLGMKTKINWNGSEFFQSDLIFELHQAEHFLQLLRQRLREAAAHISSESL